MHDKRGDDGMYRTRTDAEARCAEARTATQTHSGPFTHERSAESRRMPLAVTQFSAKLFKDKRVNRSPYLLNVGKAPK